MDIELVAIDSLKPDPNNVRLHPDRNMDAIKASLKKFGLQKPLVVDRDGTIVAGNGTLEAAKQLGWKEIQIVRSDLIGAEAMAFAIADNQSSALAEWDWAGLSTQLAEMAQQDDMSELMASTGFSQSEIDNLIGNGELVDAPEFKEYDESVADEVEFHECPQCQHKWPK